MKSRMGKRQKDAENGLIFAEFSEDKRKFV